MQMFDFDFGLGEDIDLLRESVAAFAADRIAPRAAEIDESNEFPRDLWPELGELGLLGITVEEEYGGSTLGYLAHVVAMEEISRASASVGLSYGAHSNLCVNQLETGAGSDVMSMRTTATRDGDEYILNGSKMWITNAPRSDIMIVYAVGTPGFSTPQKLDKLGMRGSDTSEVLMEDCRVPVSNRLAEEGKGAKILMNGLDYERVVLAGGSLGIMRACMDLVIPYVHDRKQFGRPIGEFQLMQGKVADMYTTMNSCRSYVYAVAAACDREQTTRFDAAGCILVAAEKATWMAGQAIQALGGNGYINEYPAGRLLRDAKLYEIGAGTSEIRRMLIGRELFEATGT
jgi:isovaleryl-CoA dehydrogenase